MVDKGFLRLVVDISILKGGLGASLVREGTWYMTMEGKGFEIGIQV